MKILQKSKRQGITDHFIRSMNKDSIMICKNEEDKKRNMQVATLTNPQLTESNFVVTGDKNDN